MENVEPNKYFSELFSVPNVDEATRLLGLSLCWLQIFDGFLTWIGVTRYGIAFEGNPLLKGLMLNFGAESTLVATKFIAIAAIVFICIYSKNAKWVKSGLVMTNGIYLICAVIPWIITLS